MATLKKLPVVALVGRSNVGKSTLFNTLTETPKALVSGIAGTTREQNIAEMGWRGSAFFLIDTPGLDASHAEELEVDVAEQARRAMDIADVVVFVVDGRAGRNAQDDTLARALRKTNKPIILGINKLDSTRARKELDTDLLGFGFDTMGFSARTGAGTGDLLDMIVKHLPKKNSKELAPAAVKIALMGQPNVGKSSIFNAVIGEDRVLVSPLPNTTRDLHDTEISYKGKTLALVDTVGLKRKIGLAKNAPKNQRAAVKKLEQEMVGRTKAAIQRADVVWYVLDANKRVTKHDKSILDIATKANRGVIIVVNKWDLIPDKDAATMNEYRRYFKSMFPFLTWAEIVFVSAKEDVRIKNLLDLSLKIRSNQTRHISTMDLKAFITAVANKHKPLRKGQPSPGRRKKDLPIKGLVQTDIDPPTFLLLTGKPLDTPPAFVNILEKELRREFDLSGTPIRISVE